MNTFFVNKKWVNFYFPRWLTEIFKPMSWLYEWKGKMIFDHSNYEQGDMQKHSLLSWHISCGLLIFANAGADLLILFMNAKRVSRMDYFQMVEIGGLERPKSSCSWSESSDTIRRISRGNYHSNLHYAVNVGFLPALIRTFSSLKKLHVYIRWPTIPKTLPTHLHWLHLIKQRGRL